MFFSKGEVMGIRVFVDKQPKVNDCIRIYAALGWGKVQDYNVDEWQNALNHSDFISAFDDNKLVGFIRFLTDGYHDTQILEFVVQPDYQRKAIGEKMLEKMVENFGHTDIYCNSIESAVDFFLTHKFKKNRLVGVSRSRTR